MIPQPIQNDPIRVTLIPPDVKLTQVIARTVITVAGIFLVVWAQRSASAPDVFVTVKMQAARFTGNASRKAAHTFTTIAGHADKVYLASRNVA